MGTKTRNQRLRSGQLNIAARSTRPNSFKKETLAEKPMQEDNGNFVYLFMSVAALYNEGMLSINVARIYYANRLCFVCRYLN